MVATGGILPQYTTTFIFWREIHKEKFKTFQEEMDTPRSDGYRPISRINGDPTGSLGTSTPGVEAGPQFSTPMEKQGKSNIDFFLCCIVYA